MKKQKKRVSKGTFFLLVLFNFYFLILSFLKIYDNDKLKLFIMLMRFSLRNKKIEMLYLKKQNVS